MRGMRKKKRSGLELIDKVMIIWLSITGAALVALAVSGIVKMWR